MEKMEKTNETKSFEKPVGTAEKFADKFVFSIQREHAFFSIQRATCFHSDHETVLLS